jgi:hypothetical protein
MEPYGSWEALWRGSLYRVRSARSLDRGGRGPPRAGHAWRHRRWLHLRAGRGGWIGRLALPAALRLPERLRIDPGPRARRLLPRLPGVPTLPQPPGLRLRHQRSADALPPPWGGHGTPDRLHAVVERSPVVDPRDPPARRGAGGGAPDGGGVRPAAGLRPRPHAGRRHGARRPGGRPEPRAPLRLDLRGRALRASGRRGDGGTLPGTPGQAAVGDPLLAGPAAGGHGGLPPLRAPPDDAPLLAELVVAAALRRPVATRRHALRPHPQAAAVRPLGRHRGGGDHQPPRLAGSGR